MISPYDDEPGYVPNLEIQKNCIEYMFKIMFHTWNRTVHESSERTEIILKLKKYERLWVKVPNCKIQYDTLIRLYNLDKYVRQKELE